MPIACVARAATRYCSSVNVRPFASICGIELATLRAERKSPFCRSLSSTPQQRPDTEAQTSVKDALSELESAQESFPTISQHTIPLQEQELFNKTQANTTNLEDTALPWYLQVPSPSSQLDSSHPQAQRQQLPDLPPNPPPLLEAFLNYISVDLGIDDLHLLDLRSLDPPPALGANLIMLIGSGRSEKHLHVSADRFCRWLRTTHNLTPFADGLLGRNEIKLKLRRRAKKARLMSKVGVSATSETDDGIRTGWVCINIGRVPAAEGVTSEENTETMEGIVGFGKRNDGVNLVVQMFTEEKRAEIDLESLWEDILSRNIKAKPKQTGEDDTASDAYTNASPTDQQGKDADADFLRAHLSESSPQLK